MRVTITQAAAVLERKARGVVRAAQESERASLAEGLRVARQLSSGPYSSARLRAMGHPYARRSPHPPLPAHIVNRQRGRFWRGWQVVGTTLLNRAPQASFLARGTRLMIARPITAAVAARMREWRRKALTRAVQLALDL